MSEEIISALSRIEERLNGHVERYDRDREEIKERISADKVEQRAFRDNITQKVETLESKIQPVVNDHKTVMRVFKWTGAGGTITLLGYLWNHLKDTLK